MESSSESGLRMGENRLELTNLSFEHGDIDLNRNNIDNSHSCLQMSDLNGCSQNLDYNTQLSQRVCVNSQILQSELLSQPSNLCLPHPQHDCSGSSSRSIESSSQGIQPFLNSYRGKHAVPVDDHQFVSNKRRNGGVPEQFSLCTSSSSFNQCHPTQEGRKALGPSHQAFVRPAENGELFQRNTRTRTDTQNLSDASAHNIWPQGMMTRHSDSLSLHHPVSPPNLSDHPMDPRLRGNNRSLHIQTGIDVVSTLISNEIPVPWNEIPGARLGESSRSRASTLERSAIGETPSRNVGRDNIAWQPLVGPFSDSRPLVADATNWGLVNGNTVAPQNVMPTLQAGSINVNTFPPQNVMPTLQAGSINGSTVTPHNILPTLPAGSISGSTVPLQNVVTRSTVTQQNVMPTLQAGNNSVFHQPLVDQASSSQLRHSPEIRALPPVSEYRPQSMVVPPPRGNFPISQEIGHNQRGTVLHGRHQPNMSSQISRERQNGVVMNETSSVQSLAASTERRSRILAEFINRHNIFRGDNLTLQDVSVFEHSLRHRGAFVDRHRDMRLDIDNMSYEELLALEERIGNVSTGLPEEKIMKYLKQYTYAPAVPESPTEVEPCCICREEYQEGHDLGRLDCGHEFHTDCIKQWLVIKNLCPICKNTAFNT